MIPYRAEGTLWANLVDKYGLKLGVWYNESSTLAFGFAFPIGLPYVRKHEDFDTGDMVEEKVISLFHFHFRLRASHITGKRWYTRWGVYQSRLHLIMVITPYLERAS